VSRFLTVAFLLLLGVVLLLASVGQPLPLPMPPRPDPEKLSRVIAAARGELDLEPADSVFSWLDEPQPYDLALRDALLPLPEYRKCQLVVVPSFGPEWAVYLTRPEGSAPELVSRRISEPLWAAMTTIISDNGKKSSYSLGPEAQSTAIKRLKIEVDSSQAVITGETADVLEAVWSEMLERVRYPRKDWGGVDGVRYHVSHWSQDHGFRSGQTWSPTEGSRPYGLVKLAEQMHAFAQTPSKDGEERLQAAASALLSALQ
jgi:hypothetical protein